MVITELLKQDGRSVIIAMKALLLAVKETETENVGAIALPLPSPCLVYVAFVNDYGCKVLVKRFTLTLQQADKILV